MANNRKNQSKPDLGSEESMDREQQRGRGQENPDPTKGELGTEIDDEEDDLADEDAELEDENRITQRNPAQRGDRDSSK